jgi:hypothetical protein
VGEKISGEKDNAEAQSCLRFVEIWERKRPKNLTLEAAEGTEITESEHGREFVAGRTFVPPNPIEEFEDLEFVSRVDAPQELG